MIERQARTLSEMLGLGFLLCGGSLHLHYQVEHGIRSIMAEKIEK